MKYEDFDHYVHFPKLKGCLPQSGEPYDDPYLTFILKVSYSLSQQLGARKPEDFQFLSCDEVYVSSRTDERLKRYVKLYALKAKSYLSRGSKALDECVNFHRCFYGPSVIMEDPNENGDYSMEPAGWPEDDIVYIKRRKHNKKEQ